MTDALVWALAFGAVIVVVLYAMVLAWMFIQEHKDD